MKAERVVNGRPKRAIHAYIDEASYGWLQDFSEYHGPSITALLQAMIDELREQADRAGSMDIRDDVVKAARVIDAKRRRR